MRAPDPKAPLDLPPDFTETQWNEIKASLAERDADLDTEMVDGFVPAERWWLDDPVKVRRPLRDALKQVAFRYAMQVRFGDFSKELPTSIEQAKNLQKQLTAIENAIETIYRTETAYPKSVFQVGLEVPEALLTALPPKPVLAAMWRYRDELQDRIAKLRAMGSRRDQNARTQHNDYWFELARLWRVVTNSAGKFRRQHLRRFLLACTPLTLFPDMTARELERKVDSFVARFFR
jgi:hypothetical protein